jgi:hypothetical protein
MALMNNHMPEFDAKILRMDFTVDDIEREALVHSTFDTTQYFVSLYAFSTLAESDDNASHSAL